MGKYIVSKNIVFKFFKAIKALVSRTVIIECDRIPYEFHNVPMKKILNWIIVEASILLKPASPWGWPTHLQVEPTNFCNLRCALCPVSEGLNRPSGQMNFDIFKNFIDGIGDYIFIILLWDWGEPFLNPAVYDMISYAEKRNIKIVSSTNGHIFARGDNAEKVVNSGLDSLIFAIDGITQETYERYRKGGDLNTVITGIKRVVSVKRALNSKTPFINLRFIPMKHNEHEIPKLKDFARSLGVDALTIKTLNPHDEYITAEDSRKFLPENPLYQRFKYDPGTYSRIRLERSPCKTLWNMPVIHCDGKVSPCTFDPHGKYSIGDLTRETFKDIWWGTPYRRLRRQFHEDYRKNEQCAVCSYAFEGGALSTETIVEPHFFTTHSGDRV